MTLTTTIPIRDQHGRVVGEKTVVRYGALLAAAHNQGLTNIQTAVIQAPTAENGQLAIVECAVETKKGVFHGIGDASPESVQRHMVPHLLRLAETRAKARALRDALNVSAVSLEELGGDAGVADEIEVPDNVRPMVPRAPAREARRDAGMTDAQRRYLFRLLAQQGGEGGDVEAALCERAEVEDLRGIDRAFASRLIDGLKREVERG